MRKLPIVPFLLGLLLISACGGGSSSGAASNSGGGGSPAPTPDPAPTPPTEPPVLDFSALDARIQRFIDKENAYGGVAYSLVDSNDGVVHESAAGNYTTDTIVRDCEF